MTRSDLFDVTSIPGIEELGRAGAVSPDPDALRAARARLETVIAADPTSTALGIGSAGPTVGSSRRRWVGRSLAVAAALALLPLGRIGMDTANPAGAQVAIAADGSLQCSGNGYATAIDPRDADLRLLPATLPKGWQVDVIAARWEVSDDPAACQVPALSLARLDSDRVIDATVSVRGPFPEVDAKPFLGSRVDVEVAGAPGLLLDSSDLGLLRWVWTSESGTWVMEAQQLTRKEGERLAAGITTTGTSVAWQPAKDDLDLQVVAQRPGPPPTYRPAHLTWYVGLAGPEGRAANYTVFYQPEHPTPALAAAHPGAVVSSDGSAARIEQKVPDEGALILAWRDGLTIHVGSGRLFYPDKGVEPSSETLGAILDALAPVDADDPRLTEDALDEKTEVHP